MRWCNWPLFLAVVLSGAGSLMYQLAWTRQLASITSATHTAQAVVLAVFMTGLAVGAYLGGRLSRRAADRDHHQTRDEYRAMSRGPIVPSKREARGGAPQGRRAHARTADRGG